MKSQDLSYENELSGYQKNKQTKLIKFHETNKARISNIGESLLTSVA